MCEHKMSKYFHYKEVDIFTVSMAGFHEFCQVLLQVEYSEKKEDILQETKLTVSATILKILNDSSQKNKNIRSMKERRRCISTSMKYNLSMWMEKGRMSLSAHVMLLVKIIDELEENI